VDTDYGLRKLSSYLRDPQLSLGQACLTFRETFLGA
jgi:type VI secretion system protein ImpM